MMFLGNWSFGWKVYGLILLSLLGWQYHCTRLEQQAAQGQANAQYTLARGCMNARALGPDCQKAVKWLRKAAEQGHAQAQTTLALLYVEGQVVPQDLHQAAAWLGKAADQGYALAQNQLGVMYVYGEGVPRDLNQAMYWYAKAAAQGLPMAKQNLEVVRSLRTEFDGEVITHDGRVYSSPNVVSVKRDGILLSFAPKGGGMGLAKINLRNLPDALQGSQRRLKTSLCEGSSLAQLGWMSLPN